MEHDVKLFGNLDRLSAKHPAKRDCPGCIRRELDRCRSVVAVYFRRLVIWVLDPTGDGEASHEGRPFGEARWVLTPIERIESLPTKPHLILVDTPFVDIRES
ncbi:MAG: hypothetical protein ACR2HA_13425 [Nocardioides sp.]